VDDNFDGEIQNALGVCKGCDRLSHNSDVVNGRVVLGGDRMAVKQLLGRQKIIF